MENNRTRSLVAVSKSMIKGVAYPSVSSVTAFEWLLRKIVRSNTSGFALTVINAQLGNTDMDSIIRSPEDIETLKRLMHWEWETHKDFHFLQYFEERCCQIRVAYTGLLKKGNPKTVILDEVKENRPDLLVIGSRGLDWQMGMISQKVYRTPPVSDLCSKYCECPIIIIKRREGPTRNPYLD